MIRAALLIVCVGWSTGAMAQAECRQALAMGLDVSGSVDGREYRLQLDGLALALGDERVAAALLDPVGGAVRLLVYEWSDPTQQRLIVPWTPITDRASLAQVQAALRATRRAELGPSTGLGDAMRVGFSYLDQQTECGTRTLDISGDGKGNTGRRPQDITELPEDVNVNGLVIDADAASARDMPIGELAAYYRAYVIRGSGAFVETAQGFEDYADAMRRKLLRELKTFAIGQLSLPIQ